jgi:outer membrane protein, heavy metal efflux system
MKLSIKIYLILCAVLAAFPAPGQTVSLDSVLRAVGTTHPGLAGYDLRAAAMNAYTQGATAWMAPMVGAGTFMTPYPGQTIMEGEMGDRDRGSLMFSFEQEIPNPAKLRARKAYYNSRAAVEQSTRDATYNGLRAQVKELYYSWAVLEKKRSVLQESARIMETMKKLAEIRYPYAQGNLGNTYKAEGRLQEVQNMLLMTDAEIAQKNARLNALMSLPQQTRFAIDVVALEETFVPQKADTLTIAANRSDIRAMNNAIESMRLNRRLMSFDAKPDFRLRFDHMAPFGSTMPSQFTVMGMMSIPIAPWSAKMYKSGVKAMDYEIEAMQKNRESMLLETRGMVNGMAAELEGMKKQLQNYREKIIPALQKNYSVVMLAYEENKEDLPMVIDAWETLNMAQMQYLDQLQKYYLMIVDYEKELEK